MSELLNKAGKGSKPGKKPQITPFTLLRDENPPNMIANPFLKYNFTIDTAEHLKKRGQILNFELNKPIDPVAAALVVTERERQILRNNSKCKQSTKIRAGKLQRMEKTRAYKSLFPGLPTPVKEKRTVYTDKEKMMILDICLNHVKGEAHIKNMNILNNKIQIILMTEI